jgi:3-keto-5-aminohexanoate cleavage enzyme
MERIRSKCDLIFQPSTGGAVWHKVEERSQPLEINPEMATLSAGTCNFGDDVFFNSEKTMEYFALEMKEKGIKPEIEVFEKA